MVDTEDLKSSGIISRAGSSPASSMPNRERARSFLVSDFSASLFFIC